MGIFCNTLLQNTLIYANFAAHIPELILDIEIFKSASLFSSGIYFCMYNQANPL